MATTPRVTVFIPVHNRQHYITTAVDSILAQTFEDFELLIVDDGSTDATLDVLARYQDPRLRVESNPRNLGIPATRNRGLELARGEYIALLDSDDISWPNRLARQALYAGRWPEPAGVRCWWPPARVQRLTWQTPSLPASRSPAIAMLGTVMTAPIILPALTWRSAMNSSFPATVSV